MDKLSKNIMKFMRKKGDNTEFSCSISDDWDEYADVAFHELVDSVKDDPSNISSAISVLIDDEWLEYRTMGNSPIGIYMTHKGLHQKEYERMAWIDFILKSVFVPVLVSILTSAIVSVIGYLWTMSGVSRYGPNTPQTSQLPSSDPIIEETIRTNKS